MPYYSYNSKYPHITPSTYVSPLAAGKEFEFVSAYSIFPYIVSIAAGCNSHRYVQKVYKNGDLVFENEYIIYRYGESPPRLTFSGEDIGYTTTLEAGATYVVYYSFTLIIAYDGGKYLNEATYSFVTVENKLPLKKWTIKDVINRLLDVAEPIRKGESPRFKLNESQAALFDNILAPQFSFTKQTLRECLQEVGGVVHGEPRLNIKNDGGGWYYEISYDMYGGTEISHIATRPYIKETVKQVIEQYCTSIDTSAENLINALGESAGSIINERNGVMTEPYDYGFKTVRCDTMYERITEDNMEIVTQLPIYSIEKLECGIIPNNTGVGTESETRTVLVGATSVNYSGSFLAASTGEVIMSASATATNIVTGDSIDITITGINGLYIEYTLGNTTAVVGVQIKVTVSIFKYFDITPYVFESSLYNSQLSSYDSAYPYSKAYALTYTQGEKNITALNFKQDNPISSVFERYSIVNILREVSGKSISISDYPLLAFRVTYTPYYSARVAQTKPYYKDFPRGSALVYNQSSNVIESRYYGENLKGVVARLGNVELTKTYRLSRLGHVPKAGQKYDNDYYISAVSVELHKDLISVTIGLSKDFNRLSQYIGISSEKRYSEVSETQSQERNVLYREYIVLTSSSESGDSDSIIGDKMLGAVRATFLPTSSYAPLTNVVAWGTTAQDNALSVVQLPLICSAFGNSISFAWEYEDNYSAGPISQYAEGDSVSGYFQNNYCYTDYYGRLYYYDFDLKPYGTQPTTFDEQKEIGLALPAYDGDSAPSSSSGYLSTLEAGKSYILRKDNRETLKVSAQIDFVTDISGLIIGSALASNSPLVGGSGIQNAKLYVFTEPLDKFIGHVAGSLDIDFVDEGTLDNYTIQTIDLPNVDLDISEVANGKFSLGLSGGVFPGTSGTKYKAWAIVTAQIAYTEEVEDETGESTTQTVQYGGDVLIAQNMEFSAGDTFSPIYFTRKREIFDKTAWVTAR